VLVLNKFPIIAGHFILATKDYKEQTDDLEELDLEATFACLRLWEEGNGSSRSTKLFAFFNSGEHSGASQPHRHIQFLPMDSILEGFDGPETPQLAAFISPGMFKLITGIMLFLIVNRHFLSTPSFHCSQSVGSPKCLR